MAALLGKALRQPSTGVCQHNSTGHARREEGGKKPLKNILYSHFPIQLVGWYGFTFVFFLKFSPPSPDRRREGPEKKKKK